MLDTEHLLEQTGETLEYARHFVNKKIELVQLEVAERTSKVTASLITAATIALLSLFVLFMLSVALALALAQLVHSYSLGFLIVGAIYLGIVVLIYFFKRQLITNPILTFIIQDFFENDKD